ncbi:MAG TPA: hypothetical protein P5137_06620 [Candidatus Brocadiia bacterium]|nr:hypothetical protein [Candidatus Brocadiia bacterium]
MAVVAGIDEAGYGPLLGPLVVSAAAFRVGCGEDDDLWEALSGAVARARRRGDDRVAVADSKALLRAGSGLAPVEEGVLAFLALTGDGCPTWRAALERLDPDAGRRADLDRYPWYAGRDATLPVEASPERVEELAGRLSSVLSSKGVSLAALWSAPMEVIEFNALTTRFDSKSMTVASRVFEMLRRLWAAFGAEGVRVVADKLGGRNEYRRWLMAEFTGCDVRAEVEGAQESTYVIRAPGREMKVSFEPKADARRMAVALASMVCKYMRELMMGLLNSYWSQRAPQARPTAGYVEDGRRFLQDVAPQLDAEPGLRELLIRAR